MTDLKLVAAISFVASVLMVVYMYRSIDNFNHCLVKAAGISGKYAVPIAETLELCR